MAFFQKLLAEPSKWQLWSCLHWNQTPRTSQSGSHVLVLRLYGSFGVTKTLEGGSHPALDQQGELYLYGVLAFRSKGIGNVRPLE